MLKVGYVPFFMTLCSITLVYSLRHSLIVSSIITFFNLIITSAMMSTVSLWEKVIMSDMVHGKQHAAVTRIHGDKSEKLRWLVFANSMGIRLHERYNKANMPSNGNKKFFFCLFFLSLLHSPKFSVLVEPHCFFRWHRMLFSPTGLLKPTKPHSKYQLVDRYTQQLAGEHRWVCTNQIFHRRAKWEKMLQLYSLAEANTYV